MHQLIQQHPTLVAVALYWIFSAAVSAMPTPTDKSGGGYRWLFGFSHTLAGSIARVAVARLPFVGNGNGNGVQTSAPPTQKE